MGRRVCLLSKLENTCLSKRISPSCRPIRTMENMTSSLSRSKHAEVWFRFWIWFVGNVAPVFQNQLMRMVAAFASQEPAAKETIGKVRQNQCNLWFLFRIQLSAADDSLDWHRFRVKKRLFRNGHEFFWNALLNQLFISSLTAVDQFHSYDNIIPNILYVCDFLIWCFCSFPWGAIIENYWSIRKWE